MKCQNCGKNEINFHYSSNVNGNVSEAHLCSECASKMGYGFGRAIAVDSIFDSLIPLLMPRSPMTAQMTDFSYGTPWLSWARTGLDSGECGCGGSCEMPISENNDVELDGEMKKRREINVIREQMLLAAEKEDYEKAAELRDQIKQMENGNAQQ